MMKLKGYNRIKKIDIKKWLLGGNSKIYAVILILFLAAVLFVFKTVVSMNSDENMGGETQSSNEELTTQESSSEYVAANQKYLIKINKSKNFITVYTMDSSMEFTVVYDSFWCSVNSSVDTGKTFISDKSVWYTIADNSYGHYASRLDAGVWIYSVPYYSKDYSKLNVSLYNNLGKTATAGTIYMEAGKAKWIYENCGKGTVVEIYEDSQEQIPSGLEELETLDANAYHDPSDRPQSIEGVCPTPIHFMNVVKDRVVEVGSSVDLLEGASAFDIYGKDITSYIKVEGTVDTSKEGVYPLTYTITDNYGGSLSYYREVTVVAK